MRRALVLAFVSACAAPQERIVVVQVPAQQASPDRGGSSRGTEWWCTTSLPDELSSCHSHIANCEDMRHGMIGNGNAMSECHRASAVYCFSTTTPQGLALDECSESVASCEFMQRSDPRVFKTCAPL